LKIVYRYILLNFLKKFIPSFIVIYFIFVLQSFWLYFDELAGKGLGLLPIIKFLTYISPFIILNAIPLSILLGGIMSYGSMSEKSEFTAIKTIGISLTSLMKSMSLLIIIIAIGSFIFANTALPYGNYKFSNLRKNIKQKMPSIAITEGIFNNFQQAGLNIHVKKKYGKNNNKLKDIIIHQKVNGVPDKLIIAKKGVFKNDVKNQLIQLVLKDGYFYEDLTRQQNTTKDRKKHPATKSSFKEHIINIDISGLNKVDLDKTSITSAYHMLNVFDLKKEIDTLNTKHINNKKEFTLEILHRNRISHIDSMLITNYTDIYDVLEDTTVVRQNELANIYSKAVQKTNSLKLFTQRKFKSLTFEKVRTNKYIHAFFEKFTYPLMVIIMFLVGISLGAIIKKGGFGISIVFGVIVFISYYILNMLGKNAAEEGAIPAYLGAWIPVIVLLPISIYLTYKANNDGEFTFISNLISQLKQKLKKIK